MFGLPLFALDIPMLIEIDLLVFTFQVFFFSTDNRSKEKMKKNPKVEVP